MQGDSDDRTDIRIEREMMMMISIVDIDQSTGQIIIHRHDDKADDDHGSGGRVWTYDIVFGPE